MSNTELTFKSIDNSINKDDKDWTVLSLKITKLKSNIEFGCNYCLYRKIAYIDKNNKSYQTGSLFVPMNNIKNVLFFFRLLLSGKTFGHFVNTKYPNLSRFRLLEIEDKEFSDNLLFDKNAKIRISKRVIYIPNRKFKFYVEEELEIL